MQNGLRRFPLSDVIFLKWNFVCKINDPSNIMELDMLIDSIQVSQEPKCFNKGMF